MTASVIGKDVTADESGLMPPRYDAAIFDFDGTLAESGDVWKRVDDAFFAERGLEYSQDYAEKMSVLGFEDGARYTIDRYGLSESVSTICALWNEMGKELYRSEVDLRPGASDYVRYLISQGIPVGLATTNAPDVIEAMEPRVPILDLFPIRVYACEVERKTKDKPDIYLECLRRLGVDPDRCVIFEDLPVGLRTARSLGMTCVGLLTKDPSQNVKGLFEEADFIIREWTDLRLI